MSFDHPFYFLRHGETDWNREGRTQGQLDSQLSELGRAQAVRAADILASRRISRIIASPLSRARHTAEAVAEKHNLVVSFDEALMECHLGDHQGQPHGDWLMAYWTGDHDPPNGETLDAFSSRVWHAMRRAVAQGPDTLIVAHGGLWIAAHRYVSITPELRRLPNALPLYVEPGEDGWMHTVLDGETG